MELSRSFIFSVIVAASVLTIQVQSQQYDPIQVLFPNSNYSGYSQNYANQFRGLDVTKSITPYDGHLFQGLIQSYDRLLFNQTYRREANWFWYNDVYVKFTTGGEIISAIRVYNRLLDGGSYTARLVSGGVGYQYVQVHLSSSWRRGILYNVQVFGH